LPGGLAACDTAQRITKPTGAGMAKKDKPRQTDYYSKDEWQKALRDVGVAEETFIAAHTILVNQDIKRAEERKKKFK
jgi:hypothetical protein